MCVQLVSVVFCLVNYVNICAWIKTLKQYNELESMESVIVIFFSICPDDYSKLFQF